MPQIFDSIVQFLDPPSLSKWAEENTVWLLALIAIAVMGFYFFKPKLLYWFHLIRQRRLYWKYQALVGRSMSKRARDKDLAEDLHSFMLDRVKRGKMTHKEKRQRLRLLEIIFELEPGTIGARPGVQELKRRIRGRLSAESANIVVLKPIRRLAAIMNSKG
jgi:hypothetical protein